MVLHRLLCSRLSQVRLSVLRQTQYSTLSEMQNAYICQSNGGERFTFTFHYVNDSLGVDRKFNLNRQSTEAISTFLDRIQCNVAKIVNEKHAKRRKKAKKKQGEDSSDDNTCPAPQVTVELLRSGNPVPTDETCQSILECKDLVLLSLNGKKYNVVVNPPWVDEIQLPKSILSNFPVYPSKFVGTNLDRGESEFVWFRKLQNEVQWQKVGSGFIYTPSTEDINYLLKITCQPKKDMISGPVVESISKSTVEAGPGECPFELRHAFTKERTMGNCFRVMTYNILAGMYSDTEAAKSELFAHCPAYALDIDYRKQLFMKEILGYNADIICLQEVDERVFENDLQPILGLEGYTGVFHKKGSVREGLACLVNTKRFRLVESHLSLLSAEFSDRPCYQKLWQAVNHNEALLERLKDRGTSSQATVLQSTENSKKWLVVGNTHLYFHPDADHVRLLQGGQTILFIEDVVNKLKEANPDADVSVILCGDFNSTPECGVFQLMTTGYAPENLVDWKSNEAERITGLSLSQPFKLDSACGTPQFTNYTVGFSGCLDYIFYQTDSMRVKEVLPLYSEEELQKYTALPNIVFPSDHVALVSEIEWSK
ncbi:2',5'-phosphodiesterase 12 [Thrips palmi]|uniref:2',5'-phosphodiesterase 12 n=1 Tax=Thrips palmi TaxID=161013 RepID=A0A6P8Y561_THRPL|nr:2',5'-phosphodiesterase 12 [Thrips palmi]XP_034231601.1 2',5'-phosphodiesterase 12 [Thrips palmi]XP_034231602.1 2',5'-phosphodiesterase 12 [Thrips palmi]XP_034231603.1 2',5'-phosphodiesterase 12 [Thrips palmi]